MTIRFIGLDGGTWLRQGSTYVVQSIYFDQTNGSRYRVLGEEAHIPALFPTSDFEIIEATMPSSWIVHVRSNGDMEIGPAAWIAPEFWERFFDGDPDAIREFECNITRIDKNGKPITSTVPAAT